jgi:hypothetical protein
MKTILVIITPALVCGILFWCLWGHDFGFYLYSGNYLLGKEEFTLQGKVLLSAFFGLAASAIVAVYLGVRRVVRRVRENRLRGVAINPIEY